MKIKTKKLRLVQLRFTDGGRGLLVVNKKNKILSGGAESRNKARVVKRNRAFPLSVTARHLPDVIQLGDINEIEDVPQVDIITAGTPCQDLSVAGKRSGIRGEKSGLFFRAVELVRRRRPEFFVWENVPHVLNIRGGKDFATILEDLTQTAIPIPERDFGNAGVVDGKRSQVAWRV